MPIPAASSSLICPEPLRSMEINREESSMKKLLILSCCLALAVAATALVYNQDNFNATGRMFQPAPEGYVVGKDNGPGQGLHHAGEDCAGCHVMGGLAD